MHGGGGGGGVGVYDLPAPSLVPSDPVLNRYTLPSDSSGWNKTRNRVFPPHSLVYLEKKQGNISVRQKVMSGQSLHNRTS